MGEKTLAILLILIFQNTKEFNSTELSFVKKEQQMYASKWMIFLMMYVFYFMQEEKKPHLNQKQKTVSLFFLCFVFPGQRTNEQKQRQFVKKKCKNKNL